MADKTASFSINLEGNAKDVAREDAAAMAELRSKFEASQNSIKEYGTALRLLRGKSNEVTKAKEELKSKLDVERNKMSANALAALKLGGNLEKLTHKTKEAKVETVSFSQKLDRAAAVFAGFAVGLSLFALGEFTSGFENAVTALVRFIAVSADALRSMGLLREAAAGSAQNAYNLGTQVDVLARKVPTSKAALNDLSVSLTRALSGTHVSGQGIVDTFNLVSQASAAMGDEVGNQLGEIVKRGKQFGRLGINPFELQGTGIQFTDVAAALAKQLHISVGKAQEQLRFGMVEVNAGAAAIRDVVEKRFGEINARKLLSLDVQAAKFKERLQGLASGVNLEPFLKMLDRISSLFDVTTVSGHALQTAVTAIGNALFGSFADTGPFVEQAVKRLIIGALKITIGFLKVRKLLIETFKVPRNVFLLKAALAVVAGTIAAVIAAFVLLGGVAAFGVSLALAPIIALGAALAGLWYSVSNLYKKWTEINWSDLGHAVINGIKNGLLAAWHALKDTVIGLGTKIGSTFKDVLGISSPSKVFAGYGEQIGAGAAQGIDRSAPAVQSSAAAMAPAPPPAAMSAPAPMGHLTIEVNVNMGAASHGASPAQQVTDIKAAVTQAIKLALRQSGAPVAA